MPKELWPEEGSDEQDMIEKDTGGPVLPLDRRQDLVFIGQNLNETAIIFALNDCLITRAEASRARTAGGERRRELYEKTSGSSASVRSSGRTRIRFRRGMV